MFNQYNDKRKQEDRRNIALLLYSIEIFNDLLTLENVMPEPGEVLLKSEKLLLSPQEIAMNKKIMEAEIEKDMEFLDEMKKEAKELQLKAINNFEPEKDKEELNRLEKDMNTLLEKYHAFKTESENDVIIGFDYSPHVRKEETEEGLWAGKAKLIGQLEKGLENLKIANGHEASLMTKRLQELLEGTNNMHDTASLQKLTSQFQRLAAVCPILTAENLPELKIMSKPKGFS